MSCLKLSTVKVWLCLIRHADAITSKAVVAVSRIQTQTGLSKRAVTDALRVLRTTGLIDVVREGRPGIDGQPGLCAEYRLLCPKSYPQPAEDDVTDEDTYFRWDGKT